MAHDAARTRLAARLDEVLGDGPAGTLMSLLPDVEWSELAARADLEQLRTEMAAEFVQIDHRFGQIDSRFEQIDGRFEQVARNFEHVDRDFADVDRRLHGLQRGQERVEDRVTAMSLELVGVNQAVTAMTWHLLSLSERVEAISRQPLTIILSVIGAMIALSGILVAAIRL